MTTPARLTVITDETHDTEGAVEGGAVWIDVAALPTLTGWTLKPEGLCRAEACVPVRERAALLRGDEAAGDAEVDLVAVAAALGQPIEVDPAEAVVAVGPRPADLGLQVGDRAPAFTLPGVDGEPLSLDESAGKKRLLLTWSSWCGCRHELPAWQEHYAELREHGFELISIAVDDDVEAARPFVEAAEPSFRTAIDPDHEVVEAYGILNVPSAVWIDEDDRIVRTADLAYGDRTWVEFHGVEPGPHLEALRAWVVDGRRPDGDDARSPRRPPTDDEVRARLHYRIAALLHRRGRQQAAEAHFARACELAPFDWTIRRGSLPLRGEDPFGPEFFAFWDEWKAAGEPLYDD
jgi:peroxiredoxin